MSWQQMTSYGQVTLALPRTELGQKVEQGKGKFPALFLEMETMKPLAGVPGADAANVQACWMPSFALTMTQAEVRMPQLPLASLYATNSLWHHVVMAYCIPIGLGVRYCVEVFGRSPCLRAEVQKETPSLSSLPILRAAVAAAGSASGPTFLLLCAGAALVAPEDEATG